MKIEKEVSIVDVMKMLFETEKEVKEIWFNTERIDREAMILVNDRDIGLTGGLDTLLKKGDEVVILPLVHGG